MYYYTIPRGACLSSASGRVCRRCGGQRTAADGAGVSAGPSGRCSLWPFGDLLLTAWSGADCRSCGRVSILKRKELSFDFCMSIFTKLGYLGLQNWISVRLCAGRSFYFRFVSCFVRFRAFCAVMRFLLGCLYLMQAVFLCALCTV